LVVHVIQEYHVRLGIAADITTPKHDFSNTLLDLSNQFLLKLTKVLIVRDFGSITYIDV